MGRNTNREFMGCDRYKMINFKGMTYDDIRPIFEKKSSTKEEKKKDDSSKPAEGKRKKTLAKKRASGKDSEESA
ncbi:hypothetical protein Tco_0648944 [Tanacetum coccineum]